MPLREVFEARHEYKVCVVQVKGRDTQVNLVSLNMIKFKVILGMDYLNPNYASVDCHHKIVRFDYPKESSFYIQGESSMAWSSVISVMTASHLMRHGCQSFLAMVLDTHMEVGNVAYVPIVGDYVDVFLDELPRLPLKRK